MYTHKPRDRNEVSQFVYPILWVWFGKMWLYDLLWSLLQKALFSQQAFNGFACLSSLTTCYCSTSDLYFCSLCFFPCEKVFFAPCPPSLTWWCLRVGMLRFLTQGQAQAFWGQLGGEPWWFSHRQTLCLGGGNTAVCRFCKNRRCLDVVAVAATGVSVWLPSQGTPVSRRASWYELAEGKTDCCWIKMDWLGLM